MRLAIAEGFGPSKAVRELAWLDRLAAGRVGRASGRPPRSVGRGRSAALRTAVPPGSCSAGRLHPPPADTHLGGAAGGGAGLPPGPRACSEPRTGAIGRGRPRRGSRPRSRLPSGGPQARRARVPGERRRGRSPRRGPVTPLACLPRAHPPPVAQLCASERAERGLPRRRRKRGGGRRPRDGLLALLAPRRDSGRPRGAPARSPPPDETAPSRTPCRVHATAARRMSPRNGSARSRTVRWRLAEGACHHGQPRSSVGGHRAVRRERPRPRRSRC